MNISNNVSSIQTQQSSLNKSAHNIANLNTKGSSTDLSKEFTSQIITQGATEVNVNAIKTHDQMLGSLLDIKA